jgi:hypothetical protein
MSDRIHPTNDAQMVMAYVFLKAQGLAGKKIADVVVNAASKKIELAENCIDYQSRVIATDKISFTLTWQTPCHTQWILSQVVSAGRKRHRPRALKLIPFTEEFNQELLQVKGLKAKQLPIKDRRKAIGTYSADAYAQGINLAKINSTPQYQQAMAVMHLNEERWAIERRLREYYWIHYSILKPKGMLFNDGDATVDSLQKYGKKDFFVAATIPTYQKARFKSVGMPGKKKWTC